MVVFSSHLISFHNFAISHLRRHRYGYRECRLHGRKFKYLNICPSKKSETNLRNKIKEYLRYNGHKNPKEVSKGLNPIIRGWFNYFSINGVSYPNNSKRKIRYYLMYKLYKFYRRKSQRKCKLYRQNAYEKLVNYYGLYNLSNRFG